MHTAEQAVGYGAGHTDQSSSGHRGGTGNSDLPPGNTWQSLYSSLNERYRAVYKFLGRHALARAARAVPRTIYFLRRTVAKGEVAEGLARPAVTLELAAHVAVDEALLAIAMTPSRFPVRADYHRVSDELARARKMYRRRGWLDDPGSYHADPPALGSGQISMSRGWANGIAYRRISWESGYAPRRGEPGGDRWSAFAPNRTAVANLVRHPEPDRPWVIAVHGFCMGFPFMDFQGLSVPTLHRELGYNVALPVLPLHGSRRVTRISGEPFLSFDLMNAVHGLTQSVWDIRRLVTWLRSQGAESISVYGVSLGGYVSSLLASLVDGLDQVVVGIPVSDFPALFHRHSPRHLRARSVEHNITGGAAEEVYTVVSPFSFHPRVPVEHRHIFAGYGDRLATPAQAHRLWNHWGQPDISWYPGSHVAYLWSRQVRDFLRSSLARTAATVPRGA